MNKMLDRCKALKLVKAETSGEPESRPGYQEVSVHFVEFQPGKELANVDTKPRITKLTFFRSPSTRTGNIFKLSEIANCALAPAPLEVMLVLYDTKSSTSFWNT